LLLQRRSALTHFYSAGNGFEFSSLV
jgi:hypothetical protein